MRLEPQQAVLRLALNCSDVFGLSPEFDDDMDAVSILNEFLISSGLDAGSREGAQAYKLDEALS